MDTRVCSACKLVLPLDLFSKDRRRKSGYAGKCQPCKNTHDWRRRDSVRDMPTRSIREPDLKLLSLGAGVQSSTVLLMSHLGELPRLDGAIFADTGWEPDEVYQWLEWLEEESSIPIYRVSNGSLKDSFLSLGENDNHWISIPAFLKKKDGKRAMLRRQCTKEFKITPIRSKAFDLVDRNANKRVQQWLGISWDESERMSDSRVLWIENHYPLIDRRITRQGCLDWFQARYGKQPPRSSCIGCPYHSDRQWQSLGVVAFEEAVEYDGRIRDLSDHGKLYLHSSCVPLGDVQFKDGAPGQECEGYCFI